jgi:hypothetical protein
MLAWLTTGRAILRSLRIYYGDRDRNKKMDAMYARFIKAGDLAFDVGSHVGDRAGSFLRLGAKVIAMEPQPALSIEFTTIQRHVALTAIKRLAGTASYRFNAALGESQVFAHPQSLSADEICRWIERLPMEANSGDVYASLNDAALKANPSS